MYLQKYVVLIMTFISTLTMAEGIPMVKGNSKAGIDVKVYRPSGSLGILYGWRYLAFESQGFAVGGAGYTGELTNASGSFSYGGLMTAFTKRLGKSFELDYTVLAGGGGGTVGGKSSGGILIEPGLNAGFLFGNNIRAGIGLGYIYLPGSTSFSGANVALRIDFLLASDQPTETSQASPSTGVTTTPVRGR